MRPRAYAASELQEGFMLAILDHIMLTEVKYTRVDRGHAYSNGVREVNIWFSSQPPAAPQPMDGPYDQGLGSDDQDENQQDDDEN